MALIKCNECGQEVSDTCETCPKCGADIQQQIYDNLPPEEKSVAYFGRNAKTMFLSVCFIVISIIAWYGVVELNNEAGGAGFGIWVLTILITIFAVIGVIVTIGIFINRPRD